MKKLLIIGSARHGKDTVAEMINRNHGFTFESSSQAASRIFLYEALKDKYGYKTPEECFDDRVNHRKEWHDLICEYNSNDKAKLAKEIMKHSNIYVGMRSNEELIQCLEDKVFDMVIGVYDPRKPVESMESNNIDFWGKSDIIIPNSGTLYDLEVRIDSIKALLTC